MRVLRPTSKQLEKIYNRGLVPKRRVEERVRSIIDDVRESGDDALIKYTKKFDQVKLLAKQLRVSESEISGAYQDITPDFVATLKVVIENITKFYKKQLKKPWRIKNGDGEILGENLYSLDTVGVYVPAGTAPLISSVYMTVLPAQIAGVRRIVLTTPPGKDGRVNPYILVVANLLKVTEIYRLGGAQAIAGMAFGTKTIPRVDKIVGPGNVYVTEAKRQLFGFVDIDMLAGPTELVIIANKFSNPDYITADLNAQSEHFEGLSILITPSKSLIKKVKAQTSGGYIVQVQNMDEACEVARKIAPEHLEILTNNPRMLLSKIRNAGAIFLGPFSPVAVGDYVAGPSHVLPTLGTARFFSGLNVHDFMRSSHIISYSKKALEKMRVPLEKIALIEGLTKHVQSVKVRFE